MKIFNLKYSIIIVVFIKAILSISLSGCSSTNIEEFDENTEVISEKDAYSRFEINGPEKFGFSIYYKESRWNTYVLEGHVELINSTDSTIVVNSIMGGAGSSSYFDGGYECCALGGEITIPPGSSYMFRYLIRATGVFFRVNEDEILILKDKHLISKTGFRLIVRGKIYDNDNVSDYLEFSEVTHAGFTFDTKQLRCLIPKLN